MTPSEAAAVISEMTGANPGRLLNDSTLAAQKGGEARTDAWPVKWPLESAHTADVSDSPAAWHRYRLVERAEKVLNEFHVGRPADPQLTLLTEGILTEGILTERLGGE